MLYAIKFHNCWLIQGYILWFQNGKNVGKYMLLSYPFQYEEDTYDTK